MTAPRNAPSNAAPAGVKWYVRPGVVLPVIGALVIVAALFARERVAGRSGDGRLTTYSTAPQGASVFYDLARRLGWRVERRLTADLPPEDAREGDRIHAVLSPPLALRRSDVHELLQRVRAGDALLVVLGGGSGALGDSLRVAPGLGLYMRDVVEPADSSGCTARTRPFVPLWPDNRVHLYQLRWTGPPPEGLETFVSLGAATPRAASAPPVVVRADSPNRPTRVAVVGFPYGRGRVVVASDPDVLRNDVLRACDYGLDVATVRMIEYLRDGGDRPRRRLVVDEFHQGFGAQPGTMRAVASYLGGTPSGHALFQIVGAGLVLLIAAAPRAIPPRDAERIERRSPLEHVDALARAYAQVGATRTATMRLLRGVRRRVERGTARTGGARTDDAFLARAEQLAPAIAPEIARVRRALGAKVSRNEFVAVGAALERIEHSLKRT